MKHFWIWPLLASYLPMLDEEILGKELLKRPRIPSSLDWFEEVWFRPTAIQKVEQKEKVNGDDIHIEESRANAWPIKAVLVTLLPILV